MASKLPRSRPHFRAFSLQGLRMLGVGKEWTQRQAALATLSRLRGAWEVAAECSLAPEAPLADALPMHGETAELVAALSRMEKLLAAGIVARERLCPIWEDAIWLLECAADAAPEGWWQSEVAAWRARADPNLRSWLECAENDFAAKLQEARVPQNLPVRGETEEGAIDAELIEAFLSEVDERLQACEEILLGFERAPSDGDAVHRLFRHYHSLKGAAAAAGLEEAVAQLHQGESLLQSVRDGEIEVQPGALVDFFLALGDSVRALVDRACGRVPRTEPIKDLDAALARLLESHSTDPAKTPPLSPPNPVPVAPDQSPILPDDPLPLLQRLRQRVAAGQPDPELLFLIETLEQKATQVTARAAALEREVHTLRTVPLEEVFRRLPRVLRDACRQERKEAKLETRGGEVRIERSVAEPLVSALTHLVRNAVAHGIESPTERARQGKPAEGTVRVSASLARAELVVAVEDDGKGLDVGAIRRRAVALGELAPSATPTAEQLLQFIFRPGFSTRDTASEIAGRGVGLDAVAQEIQALGGTVGVQSEARKGMRVTITVPLSAEAGRAQR